ncbi:MAG: radical SAM protein [Nanoarchaeota archaeon]
MASMPLSLLDEKEDNSQQGEIRKEKKFDFISKLMQPSVFPHLVDYVQWQAETRQSPNTESLYSKIPDRAPVSINLDPTSACNYQCPHCVDKDILNTGEKYDYDKLAKRLGMMYERGLKSVIIIGGGEPTLYREFEDLVGFAKEREIQVAIVSNGTGMEKIANVAHLLGEKDWIRLSLDSASEEKFQAMHLPKGKMIPLKQKNKVPITLEQICENVRELKRVYPELNMGFSYIVTWPGARINKSYIEENIEEIVPTAYRARESRFSFLSLKAFLERDEEHNAERIGLDKKRSDYRDVIDRIRGKIDEAKRIENDKFKVAVSSNLRVLLEGEEERYTKQPKECHMSYFRQVLGIRGVVICPGYRAEASAKISDKEAYLNEAENGSNASLIKLAEKIKTFDASKICRNVVCMYNDANWFIENLIEEAVNNPSSLAKLKPGEEMYDYFL